MYSFYSHTNLIQLTSTHWNTGEDEEQLGGGGADVRTSSSWGADVRTRSSWRTDVRTRSSWRKASLKTDAQMVIVKGLPSPGHRLLRPSCGQKERSHRSLGFTSFACCWSCRNKKTKMVKEAGAEVHSKELLQVLKRTGNGSKALKCCLAAS